MQTYREVLKSALVYLLSYETGRQNVPEKNPRPLEKSKIVYSATSKQSIDRNKITIKAATGNICTQRRYISLWITG